MKTQTHTARLNGAFIEPPAMFFDDYAQALDYASELRPASPREEREELASALFLQYHNTEIC